MSNDPEKRNHAIYVMTIVQTACTVIVTLLTVGAFIGRLLNYYFNH